MRKPISFLRHSRPATPKKFCPRAYRRPTLTLGPARGGGRPPAGHDDLAFDRSPLRRLTCLRILPLDSNIACVTIDSGGSMTIPLMIILQMPFFSSPGFFCGYSGSSFAQPDWRFEGHCTCARTPFKEFPHHSVRRSPFRTLELDWHIIHTIDKARVIDTGNTDGMWRSAISLHAKFGSTA